MGSTIEKAVIVAAGRSSRLRPLTTNRPKGLLEVAGEPLLARSVRLLREQGIREIAIVVGFEHAQITSRLGPDCHYLVNPFYAACNNMGSLWFARAFVGDAPFLYQHGDVIYDPQILAETLQSASGAHALQLVTDFGPVDEEAMKVRLDRNGLLVDSSKDIPLDEAAGEWTGLALVHESRRLFEVIEERLLDGDLQRYDTTAFVQLAREGRRIACLPTRGRPWKEIDFVEDLEAARGLFEGAAA